MGEFKNYLQGEYQQFVKHQKDLFIVPFNKIYLSTEWRPLYILLALDVAIIGVAQ